MARPSKRSSNAVTRYFPVLYKETINLAQQSKIDKNTGDKADIYYKPVVEILAIATTSPFVSALGYLDAEKNSIHPDIECFLTTSGTTVPSPLGKFAAFDWMFDNFDGSVVTTSTVSRYRHDTSTFPGGSSVVTSTAGWITSGPSSILQVSTLLASAWLAPSAASSVSGTVTPEVKTTKTIVNDAGVLFTFSKTVPFNQPYTVRGGGAVESTLGTGYGALSRGVPGIGTGGDRYEIPSSDTSGGTTPLQVEICRRAEYCINTNKIVVTKFHVPIDAEEFDFSNTANPQLREIIDQSNPKANQYELVYDVLSFYKGKRKIIKTVLVPITPFTDSSDCNFKIANEHLPTGVPDVPTGRYNKYYPDLNMAGLGMGTTPELCLGGFLTIGAPLYSLFRNDCSYGMESLLHVLNLLPCGENVIGLHVPIGSRTSNWNILRPIPLTNDAPDDTLATYRESIALEFTLKGKIDDTFAPANDDKKPHPRIYTADFTSKNVSQKNLPTIVRITPEGGTLNLECPQSTHETYKFVRFFKVSLYNRANGQMISLNALQEAFDVDGTASGVISGAFDPKIPNLDLFKLIRKHSSLCTNGDGWFGLPYAIGLPPPTSGMLYRVTQVPFPLSTTSCLSAINEIAGPLQTPPVDPLSNLAYGNCFTGYSDFECPGEIGTTVESRTRHWGIDTSISVPMSDPLTSKIRDLISPGTGGNPAGNGNGPGLLVNLINSLTKDCCP
jgi:hypothetical protein